MPAARVAYDTPCCSGLPASHICAGRVMLGFASGSPQPSRSFILHRRSTILLTRWCAFSQLFLLFHPVAPVTSLSGLGFVLRLWIWRCAFGQETPTCSAHGECGGCSGGLRSLVTAVVWIRLCCPSVLLPALRSTLFFSTLTHPPAACSLSVVVLWLELVARAHVCTFVTPVGYSVRPD